MPRRTRFGQTYEQQARAATVEESEYPHLLNKIYRKMTNDAQELRDKAYKYGYGTEERRRLLDQAAQLENRADAITPDVNQYEKYEAKLIEQYKREGVNYAPVEAKLRAFWRAFKDGASRMDTYQDEVEDSFYTLSALSANPDPLGRHLLMDVRWTTREKVVGVLAGSDLMLGRIYVDHYETYGDFIRQHGGPGVRVKGAGLGSLLYMSSAACVNIWRNAEGVASPSPGHPDHNRTSAADKVWNDLVKHKVAYHDDSETSTESDSGEHCAYVKGDTYHVTDDIEGEVTSDEVCGEVEYEYEASRAVDYMNANALFTKTKPPLCAFVMRPSDSVGEQHVLSPRMLSSWDGKMHSDDAPKVRNEELLEDNWQDSMPVVARPTAELLVRSLHGDAPALVLMIAKTIRRSVPGQEGEDLMVAYLTRPDVAAIMGSRSEYLELLGQQRLFGLAGLSSAGQHEVKRALHYAQLGRAIDYAAKNPLNLPPLSAKLKQQLAAFPKD